MKYEIGAFDTIVEGKYEDVIKLINDINEHLYTKQCNEWITNVQIQIRSNGDITVMKKLKSLSSYFHY